MLRRIFKERTTNNAEEYALLEGATV